MHVGWGTVVLFAVWCGCCCCGFAERFGDGDQGGLRRYRIESRAAVNTFLRVSDIHYDPLADPTRYNSSSYCRASVEGVDPVRDVPNYIHSIGTEYMSAGGEYGRFGCDSDLVLLESTMSAMVAVEPSPAYIIMTGDFAAHALEIAENEAATQYVTQRFQEVWPDTLVIPTIGNNDCYIDYEGVCDMNYYEFLYDTWMAWIPEDQELLFKHMGTFSVSPIPGLLVISLNTNIFSASRMALNKTNDCGQLEWLQETLDSAQLANKKVYIIGHIPPGIDAYKKYQPMWEMTWLNQYVNIVYDYRDIILGTFWGHIHSDEMRFTTANYSSPEEIFAAFCLVAPSISPCFENNPAFHRFIFDTSSFTLLDYDSFYLDLAWANIHKEDKWKLEYSFCDAYQVPDLSLNSARMLFNNLATNNTMFQEWDARRSALYDPDQIPRICTMITVTNEAWEKCASAANFLT
ncbi:sphingomyelin phosphodiesterase [Pelomyxa schiedti]|nr:sphingomyelin phosphodiesterase [Pelomyxa schiedti]